MIKTYSNSSEDERRKLVRANITLALLLGVITLLALFATFYFWPSPEVPA